MIPRIRALVTTGLPGTGWKTVIFHGPVGPDMVGNRHGADDDFTSGKGTLLNDGEKIAFGW